MKIDNLIVQASARELAVHKRIIAAMRQIEQELGVSTEGFIAEVPRTFHHWLPSVSLLLDLLRHHRTDLAIEHLLLFPDIGDAFDDSSRRTARNRLEAINRLETMQLEIAAGEKVRSDQRLPQGVIAVCGDRLIWVDMDHSFGDGSCSRTADIEMGIADSRYVEYSQDQHRHILVCDDCANVAPVTCCVFNEVSSSIFTIIRAQLEALNECLDVSDERSQRLAEMQDEANEENLDEFINEARQLLAWRAIELAAFLKLDVSVFLDDKSEVNPWLRLLRGEGHPRAVAFVQGLSHELLKALFFALMTSEAFINESLWFDKALDGPFSIPTDGDLSLYRWTLDLRNTANLQEWAQTLSEPPKAVYIPAVLGILKSAALLELHSFVKPSEPTRLSHENQEQLDRIESLIGNGNALQMPIIDLFEKLVSLSSGPSAERAEENLEKLLGREVFNELIPEARQILIGAEYCFIDRKLPDPAAVIRGIALAFERQFGLAVDGPLQVEIEKLVRTTVEPTNFADRPGLPARRPRHEENVGLMSCLERKLQASDPLTNRALSNLRLDGGRILAALQQVRRVRNKVIHGPGHMSYEEVREKREIWYGLRGTSSIFSALVPLAI